MNSQKNKEEKSFIISENLATAILQYLAKKPYEEVYPLIGGLQQITPFVENEIKEEKEKKAE